MGRAANEHMIDDTVVVLPGENVSRHLEHKMNFSSESGKVPKLGPGLRYDVNKKQVYATLAGILDCKNDKGVYSIQQNVRRYRPALEDRVVGIVQDRIGPDGTGGDVYQVQIGASHVATLSNLQFEGATKRNKPTFQPGQLVYARVTHLFGGNLDPALSCINGPHDRNLPCKDWMTNEGAYGELRGGTLFRVTPALARELLKEHVLWTELAQAKLAFEVAIGVNGFLWLHSSMPQYTILIQNAVLNAAVLTAPQIRSMVKSLVFTVQKQVQQDHDSMIE